MTKKTSDVSLLLEKDDFRFLYLFRIESNQIDCDLTPA